MRRIKTRVVTILFLCCLSMVSMLFYFMFAFDEKKIIVNSYRNNSKQPVLILQFTETKSKHNETFIENLHRRLMEKIETINFSNDDDDSAYASSYVDSLRNDLQITEKIESSKLWNIAKKWVRARQTIPLKAFELGSLLDALQKAKIVKSDVSRKGTQLKLLLTLEGGQYVFFKPKRYSREYIAEDIYSGADRHNGEIIAFHLARILNFRYTPIVASRVLNVDKEIKRLATPSLLNTFVNETIDGAPLSKQCFYGECYYCNEYDLVCEDQNGLLEGAIILHLPLQYQLQKLRHPWQRTYRRNVKAQWELESNFCFSVQKSFPNLQRILDFVDTSIFDFLIGNADRHHFEVFKDVSNSAILLIDNGKSFGNPSHDEITILFPLLQCCMIRNSTFNHLKKLASHKLSTILTNLLSTDPLWPLLTPAHLDSLDRRLKTVLAGVELCFESFNKNYVLR